MRISLGALLLLAFSTTMAQSVEKPLKSEVPFPVGAAVNPNLIRGDSGYKNLLIREFNSVSSENPLKWLGVHPQAKEFNFWGGDLLVKLAQENLMRMHGHTLVWHESIPQWLKDFRGGRSQWDSILRNHIDVVVGHFAGQIASWDVVNEVLDSAGAYRPYSIWLKNLGRTFVETAFTVAHKVDPQAKLFWNENRLETQLAKVDSLLVGVADLKRRGIPIHGIGTQMHMNLDVDTGIIRQSFRKLAMSGLLIHVSELDISLKSRMKYVSGNGNAKKRQEILYRFVSRVYMEEIPRAQRYGITFWNLSDRDSWLTHYMHSKDSPLLFDSNYQKKQSYFEFVEGARGDIK